MKNLSILGALLFFMCLALCAKPELSNAGAGPKMVLNQTEIEVGDVKEGRIIEQTFVVKNEGDATLEIKNVRHG